MLFYSLVLCELLQGLLAWAAGAFNVSFGFSGIKLCTDFILNSGMILNTIILILPFILTIAAIESSIILLKRFPPGAVRHFIIVFSLVLSGYLLFDLFYGAFSVILRFNYNNDWVQLANLLNFSEGGRIAFVLFVIIFTAGYLNLSSKRIIKYINIQ